MLALAGSADFAIGMSLFIAWIGIYTAGIAALIAIVRRSWVSVIIGTVAVILVAAIFTPWQAFVVRSPDAFSDPDELRQANEVAEMAVAWMIVVAAILAAALLTWIRRGSGEPVRAGDEGLRASTEASQSNATGAT